MAGVRKWFYCSNVFMTLFYIYSVVTEGYGVFSGPSHRQNLSSLGVMGTLCLPAISPPRQNLALVKLTFLFSLIGSSTLSFILTKMDGMRMESDKTLINSQGKKES